VWKFILYHHSANGNQTAHFLVLGKTCTLSNFSNIDSLSLFGHQFGVVCSAKMQ
jgi:hypothetical protein